MKQEPKTHGAVLGGVVTFCGRRADRVRVLITPAFGRLSVTDGETCCARCIQSVEQRPHSGPIYAAARAEAARALAAAYAEAERLLNAEGRS